MIKVSDIKLKIEYTEDDLRAKIAKLLRLSSSDAASMQIEIIRRSIDARTRGMSDINYVITVNVSLSPAIEKKLLSSKLKNVSPAKTDYYKSPMNIKHTAKRPLVIGMGPAGLFAGLELAKAGLKPILIDRGKAVADRQADVDNFFKTGILDTSSNVQFGEGGAGTFSDGKLNTLIKDPKGYSRYVLSTFVECGANEEIMYDAKPHIGTDVLALVIANLRDKIIELGGEFRYSTTATDFSIKNNSIEAVTLSDGSVIDTDRVVLAIGHSARDTFKTLYNLGVPMEPKAFAVGFRAEHPQDLINKSQYGLYVNKLPAAPYKITYNAPGDRSVYSFCMCPGGYVVNASSEEGHLTVNGMSYSGRNSKNANSAIIIAVTPEDFPDNTPLGGIVFQRNIEKKAYELGEGKIPQQLLGDFIENKSSTTYGEFASLTKGDTKLTNLRSILPEDMNNSFINAFSDYGRRIKGFNRPDVILSGIEARTSSPLRILRDETMQSVVRGLFPCGEGAGYAGGITSAAIDGLKVANALIANLE